MRKAALFLLAALIVCAAFLCGYRAGIAHTVIAARVSVYGDTVLLDIDGQVYAHIAGGED